MKSLNTIIYYKKFKYLWILTNILGITSFCHHQENKEELRRSKYFSKTYILLLLIGFQATNIFQLIRRKEFSFKKLNPTTNVILTLNSLFLLLSNCITSIELNFTKAKFCEDLLQDLLQLDYQLYINNGIKTETNADNRPIWFLHIIAFSIVLSDLWAWYDALGFANYFYYAFDIFQRYRMAAIGCACYVMISDIQNKICSLNSMLKCILSSRDQTDSNRKLLIDLCKQPVVRYGLKDLKKRLNCVLLAYGRICEIYKVFNQIFGWIMLIGHISLMLTCITPINVMVTFHNKGTTKWSVFCWNLLLLMYGLVSSIICCRWRMML